MDTVYMLHGNVVNETALFFFFSKLTSNLFIFTYVIQVKKVRLKISQYSFG